METVVVPSEAHFLLSESATRYWVHILVVSPFKTSRKLLSQHLFCVYKCFHILVAVSVHGAHVPQCGYGAHGVKVAQSAHSVVGAQGAQVTMVPWVLMDHGALGAHGSWCP